MKEQKPSENGKYYAKATQPLPEAAIHGLFRFTNEKQAVDRLKDFRDTFHLSSKQPPSKKALRLWIADFAVTAEEIEQGYCGHYAVVSVVALDGGQFTLTCEKDLAPVSTHPHKKFPTRKHPGWSHPIMRAIKRGKVFETADIAQEVLTQLHMEYPETSVPGVGKLHLIVYEQRKKNENPVHKYIFSIAPHEKGGFVIAKHRQQEGEKPRKIPPKEQKGYYTAMVEEKRAKKKRTDPRQKKPKITATRKAPPKA